MSRLRSAAILLAANVLACHADDGAFYDAVFPCSIAAPTEQCGTTKSGKPMTCYAGSQLGGGSDFCTEVCDPAAGAVDPGHVCLSSGALLVRCTPVPPAGKTTNGCPAGLNCYRTDIGSNEGVCLMMRVCATDGDCTDSKRPKCVATLIHELQPLITTDHFDCVQPTCATSGSTCDVGESCSANYYNTGGMVPDVCIPNCLGDLGSQYCPPNYGCARTTDASGAASVCLPGVPGERCNHEEDCIWGHCLPTGAGFSECIALSCTKDRDCALFDVRDEAFACANGQCVGLVAFNGTACTTDSNCSGGQKCFQYSPYDDLKGGECRDPCGADLPCLPRGGVPQVCLDDGAGGCYPGNFALPCTTSSECLQAFTCAAVSPDPRTIIDSPTICTISCATDDDCKSDPLIRNGGFCKEGLCRLAGRAGTPCESDEQCNSGRCVGDATSGTCS